MKVLFILLLLISCSKKNKSYENVPKIFSEAVNVEEENLDEDESVNEELEDAEDLEKPKVIKVEPNKVISEKEIKYEIHQKECLRFGACNFTFGANLMLKNITTSLKYTLNNNKLIMDSKLKVGDYFFKYEYEGDNKITFGEIRLKIKAFLDSDNDSIPDVFDVDKMVPFVPKIDKFDITLSLQGHELTLLDSHLIYRMKVQSYLKNKNSEILPKYFSNKIYFELTNENNFLLDRTFKDLDFNIRLDSKILKESKIEYLTKIHYQIKGIKGENILSSELLIDGSTMEFGYKDMLSNNISIFNKSKIMASLKNKIINRLITFEFDQFEFGHNDKIFTYKDYMKNILDKNSKILVSTIDSTNVYYFADNTSVSKLIENRFDESFYFGKEFITIDGKTGKLIFNKNEITNEFKDYWFYNGPSLNSKLGHGQNIKLVHISNNEKYSSLKSKKNIKSGFVNVDIGDVLVKELTGYEVPRVEVETIKSNKYSRYLDCLDSKCENYKEIFIEKEPCTLTVRKLYKDRVNLETLSENQRKILLHSGHPFEEQMAEVEDKDKHFIMYVVDKKTNVKLVDSTYSLKEYNVTLGLLKHTCGKYHDEIPANLLKVTKKVHAFGILKWHLYSKNDVSN